MIAEDIEGWMSKCELRWLREQATQHELIVEIGVWKGRSTHALGEMVRGQVVAIDHFAGDPGTGATDPDALYLEAKANLQDLIDAGKVTLVRDDSINAAPGVADTYGLPTMVFVDGAHDFDSVVADIETWLPLIPSGGLLCGHDYKTKSVIMAVDAKLPEAERVADRIWAYRVP